MSTRLYDSHGSRALTSDIVYPFNSCVLDLRGLELMFLLRFHLIGFPAKYL